MRKKRMPALVAAVLALGMFLGGCGADKKTNVPATDAAAPAETYGTLSEGDAAPDFTAVLADGGSFSLREHKNEVVLLNFWATWCPPCVGEMPAFEQLAKEGIEGFSLVAVNCAEDKGTVDAFLSENGYSFPAAYDETGEIGAKYPTDGIPYTLVIRNGIIEKIYLGAPRDAYGEYKSAVEECLKK